ncbi:MAG: sigma-70 family RNA polymerase sigma factor [Planctomycetota bacterium]
MEWITSTRLLEELQSSNDGDAWQNMCTSFLPMLISFAKRLGLPASYAEDAAQETMVAFVKAFRAGNYQKERGRLHNWLFGIAYKVILNMRRKLPKEQLISDNHTGTCFWELIEDENAVKHTWNTEYRRFLLRHCLQHVRKKFSAETFKAFELHSLSEIPASEVARQLNISANAVYIASCRVLKELRQIEHGLLNTI